ncbi:multidrug resistance protein B [Klebsiella sp. RIT-PI-d]|uniref:DHA2 family efflux MFS transporter permease subunit n=1 Tax=Klebsiella sp. RIT-PI-d TaxID=1681196 RepID=UPI00067629E6|nr:DHA2 family efflux MFS transporter permease subunit [Klebsiella sp. RIT-PI-d]KNC08618.1 multidrug resistance protein B [Klebsiella sp. RIT-PI-d]
MESVKSSPEPLRGAMLIFMTFALSMATFMQMLDSTISNVAIPTISGFLGASTDEGTWVITSFGVANAISIPLTGRLAQRFGELRLFLTSVALFSLASLACGCSTSLDMLIFFRVVQGAMAGPLVPLSQSLLLRNYPPEKRTFALAMWSMTVIIAPICGPILGGYICDNFNWGWIFFINVPMGIIAVTLSATLLKGRETETQSVKMNYVGLVLLVLGVGALQLMLDKGKDLDWFNSNTILILAVVSILALVSLIIWESTDEHPILDLNLFKSRNFTIGIICTTCAFLFYSGAIVLMPQLLQETMGYNAIWAGLAYAPIGLMPLILSPIIGFYGNKIDMRILVTFSFVVYAICYYWRSVTFTTGIDFVGIISPQILQGCAVACFFLPLTTITLSGLPDDKFANASSMSNFFRTLAGSVGTSLTMTLWSRWESGQHGLLTGPINKFNPIFNEYYQKAGQSGFSFSQVLEQVNNMITQQGMLISANEIFRLSSIAFVMLTILVWFARPPFTQGGMTNAA